MPSLSKCITIPEVIEVLSLSAFQVLISQFFFFSFSLSFSSLPPLDIFSETLFNHPKCKQTNKNSTCAIYRNEKKQTNKSNNLKLYIHKKKAKVRFKWLVLMLSVTLNISCLHTSLLWQNLSRTHRFVFPSVVMRSMCGLALAHMLLMVCSDWTEDTSSLARVEWLDVGLANEHVNMKLHYGATSQIHKAFRCRHSTV